MTVSVNKINLGGIARKLVLVGARSCRKSFPKITQRKKPFASCLVENKLVTK